MANPSPLEVLFKKNCTISRQTFYVNFSASRCGRPHLGIDFLWKFKVIVSPEISRRFSHLHVDLVGPLQYSNSFNYIFTFIVCMSKWIEAIPLSETSAAACAKVSTPLVWVHRGGLVPPLQPLYHGPTRSCTAAPTPSPSESGHVTSTSPSAASRLAQPRTTRLAAHLAAADRQVHAQPVLPQPSGSHFQTRWFLHLPLLRRRHEMVLEPFSYPVRRFLHARERRRLNINAVPVSSTGTAPEVGRLTSSPPSRGQSSGGALWRAGYTRGDRLTDRLTCWVYSTTCCTVPVYKLLFIRQ
jgi:hypothetical protein